MHTNKLTPTVIAQFSDSHLFADPMGLHCGINVLANLTRVLENISQNADIDYIVFTGDLTQDHTEQSYQNFVATIQQTKIKVPVLFLAGNHDEHDLLNQYLSPAPFSSDKVINCPGWQVQLINSKSNTPSGFVSPNEIVNLSQAIDNSRNQLIMMHHHPVDVGYFIDNHGLENQGQFWQAMAENQSVRAIACGHVHRASNIKKYSVMPTQHLDVYTCPSTSIQFDPQVNYVSALCQGPAYRLFFLHQNGDLASQIIQLPS